jgi:GDPmannose 4,6-dehydratase
MGDYHPYVFFDSRLMRPTEVDLLIGDSTKAERKLGWKAKTTFKQLVEMMVRADCAAEGVIL